MDSIRKKYKPITPGTRHQVRLVASGDLGMNKIPKGMFKGLVSSGGRNNRGRIVSYHRGGGHKRLYRNMSSDWSNLTVLGFNYDPNRTSYTALAMDDNGKYHNVLATTDIKVSDKLSYGNNLPSVPGNTTNRGSMTIGTVVHNIQIDPNKEGTIARAAGTCSTIVSKTDQFVTRRIPSSQLRNFMPNCMATIGQVSGADHFIEMVGKAGRNRNWGWRSIVRGVAMNPIDHPHGGRTNGGRSDVTPWAWPTKGQPTRSKRKNSFYIVK
jgi:large subunit ribosomal protein L2